MNIQQFLDSTYLKLPEQSGLSEEQTREEVSRLCLEAIENEFKLVMIRPNFVSYAKEIIKANNSSVLVGTVIGFHEGTMKIEDKIKEAQKAIEDGADELDFVINYQAFVDGDSILVREEVLQGTSLAVKNKKVAKWIIEIAALTDEQIANLCILIRNVVIGNFGNKEAKNIFVKSSTGFYQTPEGVPNGATLHAMEIMRDNAKPLPIKAAGGVKTIQDAIAMIELGVTRIGTSSALELIKGTINSSSSY